MEQIIFSDRDKDFLQIEYPSLVYDDNLKTIKGIFIVNSIYKEIPIKEKYCIEISLITKGESILPVVRETKGKIHRIAKRKMMKLEEIHLNNLEGEICLIIPPKEKKRYPNGFDLKEFLSHIEEHLYWISYYDRYERSPWKEQAHKIDGYIQLYNEDHSYRPEVKKVLEQIAKRPLSRNEIRNIIKQETKRKKL
jgi:hypothetical protein